MDEGLANHRWSWTLLTVVATFLFAAALALPAFQKASNCGGNSAALTACRTYVTFLQIWEDDHPGEVFHQDTGGPERASLAGEDWVRSARLFAKRSVDPAGPKQIVIVCDHAYNNVPWGRFWKSPMTHAVGYSTGTTGLISPSEFAQLDLDDFVELRETTPEIPDSR